MILRCDRCHWCGTETFSARKVGSAHPKCATVDHVRSKPECLSGREYNHPDNRVNACWKCNNARATEWDRKVKAGLVFPSPWSLRKASNRRKNRERRRAIREREKAEREFLKHCKPCPIIRIKVPDELVAVFDPLRSSDRWRSGNF